MFDGAIRSLDINYEINSLFVAITRLTVISRFDGEREAPSSCLFMSRNELRTCLLRAGADKQQKEECHAKHLRFDSRGRRSGCQRDVGNTASRNGTTGRPGLPPD
jgi:hypothetical protein